MHGSDVRGNEVCRCVFGTDVGLRRKAPALGPQGQVRDPDTHVEEVDIHPVDNRVSSIRTISEMQDQRW